MSPSHFPQRMADWLPSGQHDTTPAELVEVGLPVAAAPATVEDRIADVGGRARGRSRPTGQQMFEAMTKEEQDEQFGPAVAEALRKGEIELADLVDRSADDFITGKPAQALGIDTEGS